MKVDVRVLNLDRVPERAVFMEQQCAHAGIAAPHRVSATDASVEKTCGASRYAPHSWGPYWTLTQTEIAVFESHRKIWEMIARSGRPGATFEDDILLSSTSGETISQLGHYAGQFDLIKLDALGGTFRFGASQVLAGHALRKIVAVLPSAAAYLLSPEGAAKLLRQSRTYCDHLDDFITRPRPNFRAYQLVPGLAVQGMFADLGTRRDIPENVAGSERTEYGQAARDAGRGPVSYRLMKELKRSSRKLLQRLAMDRRLVAKGGLIGEIPLADDLPPFKR